MNHRLPVWTEANAVLFLFAQQRAFRLCDIQLLPRYESHPILWVAADDSALPLLILRLAEVLQLPALGTHAFKGSENSGEVRLI